MSRNIYIDGFGGNLIGALADGTKLLEYYIEKKNTSQVVGSIYKGKVKNILNGMQAAFVSVGLDKNGYLFVSDMLVDKQELDGQVDIPTTLNLFEGDDIMVQAIKDPTGNKGVRLTMNISLAGRYLVYVPKFPILNVSRKITDENSREKLKKYLSKLNVKGGLIARTSSENATFAELKREAKSLEAQYNEILKKYSEAQSETIIYEDGDLAFRMVRDVLTSDVEKVIVADKDSYNKLSKLSEIRTANLKKRLFFHDKRIDLFKYYGLDKDVENLLRNKVSLDCGAYLIIDKTEALTVIDVNTGGFIGDNCLEDTVLTTNLLCAQEIARQVRLRNISGIIVVDFIDMDNEIHRIQVVSALEQALSNDRIKCNVLGMTGLGLVEFTRKKKRKDISTILNKDCPYCKGEGKIFSNDYIVMRIRTSLLDLFVQDYKSAIIDLNVEIADFIIKTNALSNDVKKYWNDKRIYLIPHKTYHQEFFLVHGDNSDILSIPDKAILLY